MAEKKQLKNLRPPSNLLHVGNIPDGMEHTDIKDLFVENGFTVIDSKECEGKSKMCYLKMDNPEEALRALAVMHNHNSDKVKTEVSFSSFFSRGLQGHFLCFFFFCGVRYICPPPLPSERKEKNR